MWTEDEVSDGAKAAYQDLYERLRDLSMKADELGDRIEIPVTFSAEAKELYIESYNNHRLEMSLPGFPAYLRSPFSKLEAYFLRITLILAACRFMLEGVAERVEDGDVLRAITLTNYFKEQARRVFGALGSQDPRNRLIEDCAWFVSVRGGSWKGTATDLHEQLISNYKPDRPNELSKFLKEAAEYEPGFSYESDTARYKGEEGEWKSRRVLTLSVEKRWNVVTA